MSGKKQEDLTTVIANKLDTLIRISALNLINNMKLQKDKIMVLDEAGFTPKQIADILKTTSGTVNQTLYEVRKEKPAKESKDTAKAAQTPTAGENIKREESKPAEIESPVEKSTK